MSLGTGNAPSSLLVRSSLDVEEFTTVGEKEVIDGRGEDSLAVRGGGMGQVRGDGQGKGIEACSKCSR